MRTRARVDGNHAEIVRALRGAGCLVQSLASAGKGVPDLLVMRPGGWLFLLEVKSEDGKLTEDQQKWLMKGWSRSMYVRVVRSPEEALRAVVIKVSEET